MKTYSAPPAGPFPLQENLRRLKPNLGSGVVTLATLAIFLLQGPLRDIDWHDLMGWRGLLAIGLAVAIIVASAWFLSELFLKKIFFNERGIGIVRPGSTPTWYAFDELKSGKISQHGGRLVSSRGKGKTISLEFHTGRVRIRARLYAKEEMGELSAILARRTTGSAVSLDEVEASNSDSSYRPGSLPRGGPFSAPGVPDANEPDISPKKKW